MIAGTSVVRTNIVGRRSLRSTACRRWQFGRGGMAQTGGRGQPGHARFSEIHDNIMD